MTKGICLCCFMQEDDEKVNKGIEDEFKGRSE